MNTKTPLVIIGILALGVLIYLLSSNTADTPEVERNTVKRVLTSSIGNLQNNKQTEIYVYGQVVSVTGIDVVPEINGVVTRVNKRLGSTVRPGDVVIELQNTTQAQQTAQARASVAQAQASLAKLTKDADESTRSQAQSGLVAAQSALVQTQQNTLGSLDNLYAGLQGLVTSELDVQFFTNVNTDFPDVKFDIDIENDAIALGQVRRGVSDGFDLERSYDDVDKAVVQFKERVTEVRNLTQAIRSEIDKLEVDSGLSQNTIDSWVADLARVQNQSSEFKAQASTLESQLANQRQAVITAKLQVEDVVEGADREDILSAEASVAQAEAGLLSAQIAFDKTRIQAPVFGTISEISTRVGQLVGPGSVAFSIANENALRIDANVATKEAQLLSIGDKVLVDNSFEGTISVIAPSVDQNTGRVAVQVLLNNQEATVVSGSGVGMVFNPQASDKQTSQDIVVPIESVFVRSNESYVYVLKDNKAVPRKIVTDSLFGESIEVSEGLSSDDVLVLSARGVKDNQVVEVITE